MQSGAPYPIVTERPPIMLSVVVPAYNEERRLSATIGVMLAALRARGGPFELIVADDGSRDGTWSIVASTPGVRGVRLPRNRGKGAAVRAGVLAALGERVLMTDADLSVAMDHLPALERAMDAGAAVAIGSRRVPGARIAVPQPPLRNFAGRVFTWIARVSLGVSIRDFTCGFKLFRADAARDIFGRARLDRWAYDAEILYLAQRRGWRLAQVPVTWINSEATRVRMRRDVLMSLGELALIRCHEVQGAYRRPPAG